MSDLIKKNLRASRKMKQHFDFGFWDGKTAGKTKKGHPKPVDKPLSWHFPDGKRMSAEDCAANDFSLSVE